MTALFKSARMPSNCLPSAMCFCIRKIKDLAFSSVYRIVPVPFTSDTDACPKPTAQHEIDDKGHD